MAQSWKHGYYTGSPYTCNFYRELSPNWLDLAVLSKGHRPPRSQEGEAFHLLEMGSGMGLGLCLLAAVYPEADFIGVDFQPDHIAHSRWLAGQLALANIRFVEADFIALKDDLSAKAEHGIRAGRFHYVVAHGIATWISAEAQQALLHVASTALQPGGLFYCSYNTYPGWLGRSALHMLASQECRFNTPGDPGAALQRAVALTRSLLGNSEAPLPLGRELPDLFGQLSEVERQPASYLQGEYGATAWAPQYVAQMHQRCSEHQLSHCATATLPELFEEFLDDERREIVLEQTNPLMRATVFDLAINQSFRRDIFVKGHHLLPSPVREQLLAAQRFCRIAVDTPDQYIFKTSIGEMEADAQRCTAIEQALAHRPCSLGEICLALGEEPDVLLPSMILLLHGKRIALERGEAVQAATASARRVNQKLLMLMQGGHSYSFLAAPTTGSALHFTALEALMLEAIHQQLDAATIPSCVLYGLSRIDKWLVDADGQRMDDIDSQISELSTRLTHFQEITLPLLGRLGVIDANEPAIQAETPGE
jgi:SAM-dependent methyltransferase